MTIHFGLCKSFCAAEGLVLLEYLISLGMIQHSRNCQGPGLLRNQSYFCRGPRNNVKPNIRKLNREEKLNQDEKKKSQYALGTKIQRAAVRMCTTENQSRGEVASLSSAEDSSPSLLRAAHSTSMPRSRAATFAPCPRRYETTSCA
jgi:hypothetical protein